MHKATKRAPPKLGRRQKLKNRAVRSARNIGVSDRRRREEHGQSLFGAFIQRRGISIREVAAKFDVSVPLLYRYMRGVWHKPHPSVRDRFASWFFAETRRTLSPEAHERLVRTPAPTDYMERGRAVDAWLADNCPLGAQDAEQVSEVVLK